MDKKMQKFQEIEKKITGRSLPEEDLKELTILKTRIKYVMHYVYGSNSINKASNKNYRISNTKFTIINLLLKYHSMEPITNQSDIFVSVGFVPITETKDYIEYLFSDKNSCEINESLNSGTSFMLDCLSTTVIPVDRYILENVFNNMIELTGGAMFAFFSDIGPNHTRRITGKYKKILRIVYFEDQLH